MYECAGGGAEMTFEGRHENRRRVGQGRESLFEM